jgi:hypothetical protein
MRLVVSDATNHIYSSVVELIEEALRYASLTVTRRSREFARKFAMTDTLVSNS